MHQCQTVGMARVVRMFGTATPSDPCYPIVKIHSNTMIFSTTASQSNNPNGLPYWLAGTFV